MDYFLKTGDFTEPETRLPFSDADLKAIDNLVSSKFYGNGGSEGCLRYYCLEREDKHIPIQSKEARNKNLDHLSSSFYLQGARGEAG